MRRFLFLSAVGLAPVLGLLSARGAELGVGQPGQAPAKAVKPLPSPKPITPAPKPGEGGCGKHGTTVEFLDTPSEAARQAQKEQKLVFVLHVSGHFEDPGVT